MKKKSNEDREQMEKIFTPEEIREMSKFLQHEVRKIRSEPEPEPEAEDDSKLSNLTDSEIIESALNAYQQEMESLLMSGIIGSKMTALFPDVNPFGDIDSSLAAADKYGPVESLILKVQIGLLNDLLALLIEKKQAELLAGLKAAKTETPKKPELPKDFKIEIYG
jgi:hypothetical protein